MPAVPESSSDAADLGAAWEPGRAPRLRPDESIAALFTRVGRFADIDPSKPGRLWSRWRWAGLGLWGVVVGGSVAKAWRDAGGLPSVDGDVVDDGPVDDGLADV